MNDLKKSIKIVWTIYSIIILLILIIPFFISQNNLSTVIPTCSAKLNGDKCAACGMTTSFFFISKFDYKSAIDINKNSLILYCIFLINSIIYLIFVFRSLFKKYFSCHSEHVTESEFKVRQILKQVQNDIFSILLLFNQTFRKLIFKRF